MNFGVQTLGQTRHRSASGPSLIANIAVQGANFTEPVGVSSSIDTTGADFLVAAVTTYDGGIGSSTNPALIADLVGGTVSATPLSITSILQSGSNMILSGTFPAGGSNAYAGLNFFIGGYTSSDSVDNGGYNCTASTLTTITLTNASGVTTAATTGQCLITTNIWYYLNRIIQNTVVTFYYAWAPTVGSGHTFTINTTTLAGDGGSFAIQAWSGIKSSSNPLVANSILGDYNGSTPTTMFAGTITGTVLAGTDLTITGNWAVGAGNAFAGISFTLDGYTGSSSGNNGTWLCTASAGGSITVTVPSGGFNGQSGTPGFVFPLPDTHTLVVAALGGQLTAGARSIDSGFTITDSYSGSTLQASTSMAYLVSSNSNGVHPKWTITSSLSMKVCQVAFQHA